MPRFDVIVRIKLERIIHVGIEETNLVPVREQGGRAVHIADGPGSDPHNRSGVPFAYEGPQHAPPRKIAR